MPVIAQGNIDLHKRPIVLNDDGTYSTLLSMSFQDDDGTETVIPMVSADGTILSQDDAINQYYKTGQFLGKFDNIPEAEAYADWIHRQQEQEYGDRAVQERIANQILRGK